jgi:hypothetical protein
MGGQHKEVFWGMIITALLFIVFPVLLTTVGTVMDWTGDGGNITQFTGLDSVLPIAPMLIFVAIMFGSVGLTVYGGVKSAREGRLGIALLLSVIMIAIGFLFYSIVLDGADTLLNDADINDYTGLADVVGIAPLLVLVTYIFGSIAVGGYATYRRIKRGKGR